MHDRSTTIGAYIDLPLFPPGLAVSNENPPSLRSREQKRCGFRKQKGKQKKKMGGAPARRSRKICHVMWHMAKSPPPEAAAGYAISSSYISQLEAR